MFIDKENLLSDEQVVTASAKSTDTIDLGNSKTIGDGEIHITVDEAATASGSATVTFELRTSANSDMSSDTIVYQTAPIGKADLTAGRTPIKMPIPNIALERYVDVYYTVDTGPLTAGKFSAAYVLHSDKQQAYPDAL